MNKFDEREKSFEKKFQIDEELQFKISARSNKYLAEWVCLKLNKNEGEKAKYIQEIIRSDLKGSGKEDIFKKIKKDLKIGLFDISDLEIRKQMEKVLFRAKKDFK